MTLRSWCQMNRNGHSSSVKHKVEGKPHKVLEKLKITSKKSTIFGLGLFVKFFLCVKSPMLSVGTQVSHLREHGGHSPGQPAVLSFPSRGRGWLEQILFVQSRSTHPAVVASYQLLNGSISCSLLKGINFHF